MQILIEKDGATRVPREVADLDEARFIQNQGFAVFVVADDGTSQPLPGAEPAAEEVPAAKKAAPAAKKARRR